MPLQGKTIVLGISGGIAAYKTVELASRLVKLGASVRVICTENALKFVSALSLQTITKNPVQLKQFNSSFAEDLELWSIEAEGAEAATQLQQNIDHIGLADNADLVLLAPATANTIGKLANGISDNLLLDTCLATKAPIMIAPAMNTNMWKHKKVRENLDYLVEELNYQLIEPEYGQLACGHIGEGRLADLDLIVIRVLDFFTMKAALSGDVLTPYDIYDYLKKEKQEGCAAMQALLGKKIIITMGGTREAIDPVRFIGNRSSGKMGFALAQAALELGAELELISTVPLNLALEKYVQQGSLKLTKVETAKEMYDALQSSFADADVLIMAAAVADFRVKNIFESKLKKEQIFTHEPMTLELEKNIDILQDISKQKRDHQTVIGFALETEDLLDNAKRKLLSKNLDMIVANTTDAFESNTSQVIILERNDTIHKLAPQPKANLAKYILSLLVNLQKQTSRTLETGS